jgi:glycosyltransferase involved in cell wall biosynthesis
MIPDIAPASEIRLGQAYLIFVSLEPWDEIWRRNQFLCDRLVRRNPQLRILFVAPSRDFSASVRRRDFRALRGPENRVLPGYDGRLNVTRTWKWWPNFFPLGRHANGFVLRSHLRRASRRLGFQNPVLWINAHEAGHLAGWLGESKVIYDVTDDWISFCKTQAKRERTMEQDLFLCRRADAVIVCSQRLYDVKSILARRVELIPNGVDATHYLGVLDGNGPIPDAARSWEKPVFGYTGTVHPDRVDVDLVMAVAANLKRGSIVLLGPNYLPTETSARLLATGRVHLPGSVPYADIPAWMRAFDVCIVPHRVTPFTESLNPIKLWEYLAAGKPIVSTPVAGFRDYPRFVRLAADAEGFAKAVDEALVEDPACSAARREEARRNSWDDRAERIERLIAGVALENATLA